MRRKSDKYAWVCVITDGTTCVEKEGHCFLCVITDGTTCVEEEGQCFLCVIIDGTTCVEEEDGTTCVEEEGQCFLCVITDGTTCIEEEGQCFLCVIADGTTCIEEEETRHVLTYVYTMNSRLFLPASSYMVTKLHFFPNTMRTWTEYTFVHRKLIFLLVAIFLVAGTCLIVSYNLQLTDFRPFRLEIKGQVPCRSASCHPVTNIFFLKTHKCASSTVQNLLMRFGEKHKLDFVLPSSGNYISYERKLKQHVLSEDLTPPWGFNIFCHHTRFDLREVKKIMPSDTIYITIFRHPVRQLKSLYSYYSLENITGLKLEDFLKTPEKWDSLASSRIWNKLGQNQMLYDLGFEIKDWETEELIDVAVKKVELWFDFVLIAERFEESLVLLKELLCWDILDVVFLHHNKRLASISDKLSSEAERHALEFNRGDWKLYQYFASKFEKLVEDFGRENMEQEVRNVRMWNKICYQNCINGMNINNHTQASLETGVFYDNVFSFTLKEGEKPDLCLKMAMQELLYTDKLRKTQKQSILYWKTFGNKCKT
ncbi:galactose-3-O-sulfotransferase 2-like [Limulus polyphemus]|uniref:Galactose-3-O-sulfotransferase 2-like n=1 Tax=Limulus polyphemus TaxID=6850 RepID=A0ABM1TKV8_LIMPO|nr:galactose-3-O-sulfotransferase 2-like [Limulus polyphemus]